MVEQAFRKPKKQTLKPIPGEPEKAPQVLNAYGVPPCPECHRDDFKARTALGLHRRMKHGINGKSKSAIAAREAKASGIVTPKAAAKAAAQVAPEVTPRETVPEPTNLIQCPDCPRNDFKNDAGLRIHRATQHGVPGRAHRKKQIDKPNPSRALTHVSSSNVHSLTHSSSEPPITPEDLLIFDAVGQIKGLCRFIAESAGIPTLLFTGRVAAALLHQARGR